MKAESALLPYLIEIFNWTLENKTTKPNKILVYFFSPDPAEQSTQLNPTIDNQALPTTKHQKILGVTFDTKLTFNEHTKNIKATANKFIGMLLSLISTTLG